MTPEEQARVELVRKTIEEAHRIAEEDNRDHDPAIVFRFLNLRRTPITAMDILNHNWDIYSDYEEKASTDEKRLEYKFKRELYEDAMTVLEVELIKPEGPEKSGGLEL